MRVEQRFHLDDRTSLRAQVGVFATREDYGYVPPAYTSSLQNQRPALQGRFSLTHNLDDDAVLKSDRASTPAPRTCRRDRALARVRVRLVRQSLA